MKKLVLIVFTLSIAIASLAQEKPPVRVRKAFEAKYPDASVLRWNSYGERIKDWRVLFKLDEVLHSSFFDHKGNWEITKSKILKSSLPDEVVKSINEDYYQYDIVITARFETPEKKGYEVWLDNGREGFDVQYSTEGKVMLRTITSQGYKPIDDNGNFIEQ